eukprot:242377_1
MNNTYLCSISLSTQLYIQYLLIFIHCVFDFYFNWSLAPMSPIISMNRIYATSHVAKFYIIIDHCANTIQKTLNRMEKRRVIRATHLAFTSFSSSSYHLLILSHFQ